MSSNIIQKIREDSQQEIAAERMETALTLLRNGFSGSDILRYVKGFTRDSLVQLANQNGLSVSF